ncbi:hypothetical protein [Ancylobacter pratisalsi]|uniref:Transcriptional coactivator p15 (PC4) C-terminal domain-containing protein n=1 Tax=Ancylobacter pratisalsi TaxID=1745854 RepID=A0A6P1YS16_9HYPH|nr:hypothetical protein [Ancylobacter pratisalsi]QIB35815.1 hypothetical protein G3A50_20435 [Ancylobacter pratisalsi]
MTAPALPADVATIRKNARECLAVRLCEYEGRPYLDLRLIDAASGPRPQFTKRGVTLRPSLIGDLIAALQAAQERARELGLLDGEGAR